jgi:pimeloyl-ACP methyl ester carboxylesterase
MRLATVANLVLVPLALVGAGSVVLGLMIATPVRSPPTLASIQTGARAIDQSDIPALGRFQARDGTWLAFRLYPAAGGATDRVAILAHGSTASSSEMHVVARGLARAGVTAVALDIRGHGASGTRGDIAYIGQLEDDLADLVANLRKSYPAAKLEMIGHSSGGGFVLRIAGGPLAREFDRFVLLSPFLGARAPTSHVDSWAWPDVPRILALRALSSAGIDAWQSLPVIAFANAPEAVTAVTSRYSYRLLMNYGPPEDWAAAFQAAAGRVDVIAGEADEMMDAAAYKTFLEPLGVKVTLLPGVDHMGVVHQPAALDALLVAAR